MLVAGSCGTTLSASPRCRTKGVEPEPALVVLRTIPAAPLEASTTPCFFMLTCGSRTRAREVFVRGQEDDGSMRKDIAVRKFSQEHAFFVNKLSLDALALPSRTVLCVESETVLVQALAKKQQLAVLPTEE